jgi:hypothetical protein
MMSKETEEEKLKLPSKSEMGLILTVFGAVCLLVGINAPVVIGGILTYVGYHMWEG